MLLTWFPILVTLAVAAWSSAMVTINRLTGPRRPSKIKGETFECGNPPSGSAWGRFSVRFYLTALLFLVFDVEVVFLYPWAVQLRQLGMFGFGRGAGLHRDPRGRPRLRLAARRAGLDLRPGD